MSEEQKLFTTPLEVVNCTLAFYTTYPDRWISGAMRIISGQGDYCYCAIGKMVDCIDPTLDPYTDAARANSLLSATADEIAKDITPPSEYSSGFPGWNERTSREKVFFLNDIRGFQALMDTLRATKERLSAQA